MNQTKQSSYRSLQLARTLSILFVSALMAALTPATGSHKLQAQSATCAETVVLQPGQSLASIAARVFGTQDGVAAIMAATNRMAELDGSFAQILDPNAVEAGWKLCVPATMAADAPATKARLGIAEVPPALQSIRPTTVIAANVATTKGRLGSVHRHASVMSRANLVLEKNKELMQSLLAARSGEDNIHPLSIEYLSAQDYVSSTLTVKASLPAGANYSQYLVSYQSEGLTLYAAMTVPNGDRPESGWPAIIFNHGYIEPTIYSPTERYVEYVDALAINGYVVLRPDLRGHGSSEGEAYGAYGDPGYTIDVLNALAALQRYADVDPQRIGMWGHSMGGFLTARAMVVNDELKAGVIWAGVVAPYEEFAAHWGSAAEPSPLAVGELPVPGVLVEAYGTPEENPEFWAALSANNFVETISGPVQLHHGTADVEVPVSFSNRFYDDLLAAGQSAEFYVYEGDDHNISAGFEDAMRRTLEFFDTYVKLANPAGTPTQPTTPDAP